MIQERRRRGDSLLDHEKSLEDIIIIYLVDVNHSYGEDINLLKMRISQVAVEATYRHRARWLRIVCSGAVVQRQALSFSTSCVSDNLLVLHHIQPQQEGYFLPPQDCQPPNNHAGKNCLFNNNACNNEGTLFTALLNSK